MIVVTYGAKVLSITKKFKKIVSTSHLELTRTKITIALTMKTLRLTAATVVAAVTRMLKASLSMATILSIMMMTKKLKTTKITTRIALAMTTPRLLAAVVTPSQMLMMLRMATITCQQTVLMNTSKVQNNNYISFRPTNKIFRMILL